MIPAHRTYIEPFAGASWVLFGKPVSQIEVINDSDLELINLYVVIKDHLEEFIEYLNNVPVSEFLFHDWASRSGEGIPSVTSACRTYYLIMNAFNGNIASNPSFAISKDRRTAFTRFYRTDWDAVSARLREVTILNKDYSDVIELFDSPEAFFYLDPPYRCATGNNRYYRESFKEEDHKRLKVYLSDIKGQFIMSYDDSQENRRLYSEFNVVEVEGIPNEILIYNFELPDKPFFICRKGIPETAETSIRQGAWRFPTCPYCGSRNVQQQYYRKTLAGGKRTFTPRGYTCMDCEEVFK